MDNNLYCVIMAGGVGSRFWPVSRQNMPKQFLDILGTGKSFIRQTFERFTSTVPVKNFLVVTNAQYRSLVAEHIPELAPEQILCEPVGRNTAPCIAYAAFRIASKNPKATMIVTPADHLILGEQEFLTAIDECVDFARKHYALVTIGIQPTRPDTGYGYIQTSEGFGITKVKTFTEKPNAQLAKTFVDSGEFFWNSGIFVWQVETILHELKANIADIFDMFYSSKENFGTPKEQDAINEIYPQCQSVSIDYGVLEHASDVYVRCSSFGWSDLGTWASMYINSDKDQNGNVAPIDHIILSGTKGCLIRKPEDKLAVIDGLENYIVIDTPDVLLVYPKDREQEIKQITNRLRFEGGEDYL